MGDDTQQAVDWLQEKCGAKPPPDSQLFVIRKGDAIEGVVVFSHWYAEDGRPYDAEVTLHMARPATPAIVRGILRYAFDGIGLRRLTAHPRNPRSQALMSLAGFQHEGARRGPGGTVEAEMYGLTADDYRAGPFAGGMA